ncbi:MAG: class I SAM-dependent methyltransferase [Gallionella sp.]|nr:class I SAM-dependent methyltransferase [Gallionella sp.]
MKIYSKLKRKLKQMIGADHNDPAKNIECSEFEVDNWVISEFIVKKLIPIVGTHPYPITELSLMVSAVCRLKPQQIFEWGTNIGKSARIFYEISKRFSLPLEIHSIDLPDDLDHQEHPRSTRGRMVKGYSGVSLYQADGLSKSIELYQRRSQDRTLVFIDGDHSYESVRRELAGIVEAMPDAAILLHDTFCQSEQSGYNIGPHKAVAELLAEMPGKYRVMSTTTGLPGMTLLYRL